MDGAEGGDVGDRGWCQWQGRQGRGREGGRGGGRRLKTVVLLLQVRHERRRLSGRLDDTAEHVGRGEAEDVRGGKGE